MVWSPRLESNQYPTLRRHVHYPLCYGEDATGERIIAQAARPRAGFDTPPDAPARGAQAAATAARGRARW